MKLLTKEIPKEFVLFVLNVLEICELAADWLVAAVWVVDPFA